MHTRKKSFAIRQIKDKSGNPIRGMKILMGGSPVEYEVDCPEGEGWEMVDGPFLVGDPNPLVASDAGTWCQKFVKYEGS